MLTPRLTNCKDCPKIPHLLKQIDCKLAELANNAYNDIVFMLDNCIPATTITQLLTYRRILMFKYCNPNYLQSFSINDIANKVIRLTVGCVSRCNELKVCKTTTTTTSSSSTTTTTSTSSTTTTSTTLIPCGAPTEYLGGPAYPTVESINLGNDTGLVTLNFDAYDVPDRFIVEWDGGVVIDTGYRGGLDWNFGEYLRGLFNSSLTGRIDPITLMPYPDFTNFPDDGYPLVVGAGLGSTSFNKNLVNPTNATVKIYAPVSGTEWIFTLGCPTEPTTTTTTTTVTPTTTTTTTKEATTTTTSTTTVAPTTTTTTSSTLTTTTTATPTTTTTSSTTTATPTTTTTTTAGVSCNCWQIINTTGGTLNVDYIDCEDFNILLPISPSGGTVWICVKGTPTLDPGLDSNGPFGPCSDNIDCNL